MHSVPSNRARGIRIGSLFASWIVLWAHCASFETLASGDQFRRFSAVEGLSQSVVTDILQDHRGLMWFGTWDGLNLFDGYSFTVYRHQPFDPTTLSDSRIRSLAEDQSGIIWIGTMTGLNRFDPETGVFRSFVHDPSDPTSLVNNLVTELLVDSWGVLWIGTEGGLNRFDSESGTFSRFPDLPEFRSANIQALFEDSRGAFWIGTTRGLLRLDQGDDSPRVYRHDPDDRASLSHNTVRSICEGAQGDIWLATNHGLNRWDPRSDTIRRFADDPPESSETKLGMVETLHFDRSGILWASDWGRGLHMIDRARRSIGHFQQNLADPASLGSDYITKLYEDASGVLWIGSQGGGLYKSVPSSGAFVAYRHIPNDEKSLTGPIVTALLQDSSGTLWAGNGSGLDRIDLKTRESQRNPQLSSAKEVVAGGSKALPVRNIGALLESRSGGIWIGHDHGFACHDPQSQTWRGFRFTNRYWIARDFYEDRFNRLWVATGMGLALFDPQAWAIKEVPTRDWALIHLPVNALLGLPSGVIWVGTRQGLIRYDSQTGESNTLRHDSGNRNSLSHDHVTAIYQDRDEILWLGTYGGGLSRFDSKKGEFRLYDERHGLPSNIVYCIAPDDGGRLWLSTNNGLARLDTDSGEIASYTVEDGLSANEFNSGACWAGKDGALFFGSVDGLTAVYPERLRKGSYAPPVLLTCLRRQDPHGSQDRPLSVQETLRLPADTEGFTVEFAAADYRAPSKNGFAYRLLDGDVPPNPEDASSLDSLPILGAETEWIDLGTNRCLELPKLAPGKHVLQIRGRGRDGVWSPEPTVLNISVESPWWAAWWMRALAGLTLATCVGGALVLWRHSLRSQRLSFEKTLKRSRKAEIPRPKEGTRHWWLRRARSRLDREFNAPPSVKELAAAAGVHPDYFSRCFREEFGLKIGEYIELRRLEWAADKLATTRRPISEIALAAGFVDQSHLTRRFKLHFHFTPAQFRRAKTTTAAAQAHAKPTP